VDISRYTTLGQPMLGWDTYVAQRPVYARRISANLDICATLHLTALSNVACVVHLQPLSHRTKQSLSHENFHIPMLKAVGCLTKEYCAAFGVASRGPNRQANNPTRFLLRLAEECKDLHLAHSVSHEISNFNCALRPPFCGLYKAEIHFTSPLKISRYRCTS
jgi:hypothetical protein